MDTGLLIQDHLASVLMFLSPAALKEIAAFKCGEIMAASFRIASDPPAMHSDFLKDDPVTCFDRAESYLS